MPKAFAISAKGQGDMTILPEPFQDLDFWAEKWNFSDIAGRYGQRKASTMAELRAFYEAVQPRMQAILDHLDGFSIYQLPEPERRLYRMLCGLCEASAAVELLGTPYLVPPDGHDLEYRKGLAVL